MYVMCRVYDRPKQRIREYVYWYCSAEMDLLVALDR